MEKQRKTFLSYSRANKDFAVRLARELKSEGFSVWLDQLDIPAGARWDREVEKALKECEIFMIILTPASINSENVLDEIGYAIDTGKRFLPVLLEKSDVPLRLRRFQYVDFTNKSFNEGVESAKALLRNLIAQTSVPLRENPAAATDEIDQAEAQRFTRQKNEPRSVQVEAAPAVRRAEPPYPNATQKKLSSGGLLISFILLVLLVIAGIGYAAMWRNGRDNSPTSIPATEAPAVVNTLTEPPATEPPTVVNTPTESPATEPPAVVNTLTEPPATEPPVTISQDLLAYYTLNNTDLDSANIYPSIHTGTGSFIEDGIYCDGVEYSCIQTPPITTLNYQNFSISADFRVDEYPQFPMPVFVGGEQWRWIGFNLYPNGNVGLLYNNEALVECPGRYNLNTWHNALVTYDGSNGNLYLDNNVVCTITFTIVADGGDADKNISSSNYSNATALKGFIRNLKIYKMAITP
jgi:hypothetical protein